MARKLVNLPSVEELTKSVPVEQEVHEEEQEEVITSVPEDEVDYTDDVEQPSIPEEYDYSDSEDYQEPAIAEPVVQPRTEYTEEEEAEAVEEASPYDPRHESFLVLRWRREHLAHRAERDVDEAEDEEEACDAVLQEVESLCDDLDELVHDFLDGLCEVVRQRPVLVLAFKVCSTVGRDSSAKFGNEECGIDGRAARIADLEVAVRSRGVARRALAADEMPRTDGLPRRDMDFLEMPVERRPAAFMLDDDSVAVAVDPARMCDDARSGRDDGCIVVIRDVDARMKTACACDRMDAPAERR